MSVKKLLVLSAAGLAAIGATAAMAGGPDHMAMPSEPAFQNSVYLELHGGYTQSNWTDFNSNNVVGARTTSLFVPTRNGKGGGVGGADLGYNITQHIAAETGWFYIPQVKSEGSGSTVSELSNASSVKGKLNSWFAYIAGKLTVPVMENLDLYGKVGVAYRSISYSPHNTVPAITSHGHYWAPVFAAGLQYLFASNWIAGAQYMHLPSNSEVNLIRGGAFGAPNAAPELNQYTAFLGYKFMV